MQNTTAFELITILDAEQQREFRVWLESPFFNTQKEVVSLYDFLVESTKIIKKAKLKAYFEEDNVWKAVYPKEIFIANDKNQATRLRGLLFKISENVKKYLIYKGLDKNELLQNELLHQQFSKKKNNDFTDKNLKNWSLFLENKKNNGDDFWQKKINFLKAKIEFEVAIQNDTKLLAAWYETEVFSQATTLLHLYTQLLFDKKTTYNTAFLDDFIAIFEKNIIEKPIALQLQLLNIKMNKNIENTAFYKELKQLFQANMESIDKKLSDNLVLSLNNVAIILLNKGNDFFIKESFEWSLEKIKRKQNFENGYMTTTTFKNTLRLGFNLIHYKKEKLNGWTPKQFIKECEPLLHPDWQETYISFAKGFLDFQQENDEAALPKMKAFKPNVVVHQLDAMRIVLAIHYQLRDNDAFEKQKKKINVFLEENKLSQAIKNFNLNFILFLEKIKEFDGDKKAEKELLEEIKNEKSVADKEWLLSIF